MATEIEEGQFVTSLSDWRLGVRVRQNRDDLTAKCAAIGVTKAQLFGFLAAGGAVANDAKKAEIATAQGINPANLALIIQMLETMAPLFMSGCGA